MFYKDVPIHINLTIYKTKSYGKKEKSYRNPTEKEFITNTRSKGLKYKFFLSKCLI